MAAPRRTWALHGPQGYGLGWRRPGGFIREGTYGLVLRPEPSPGSPTARPCRPHAPPIASPNPNCPETFLPPAPRHMLPIERMAYIEVQVESRRRVTDLNQHFLAGEWGDCPIARYKKQI